MTNISKDTGFRMKEGAARPNFETFVIETDRIRLVPLNMQHAEAVFREFTPTITRYMSPKPPEKIEDTEGYISLCIERRAAGNDLAMVILNKHTDEFLGCAGLHGFASSTTPELGIWVKSSAHGLGYGREAVTALYVWAVKNIVVDYFIYPVDRANFASRRIPESLGGKIASEGKSATLWGGQLDEVVYHVPSKM